MAQELGNHPDGHFEDHCWRDVVDPQILEVYRSYQRETYVGDRPALLAIDLYNLVYEGGPRPVGEVSREHPSACGLHAYEAIAPTRELFSAVRRSGIPIIYTTAEKRPEASARQVRSTNRRTESQSPDAYEIRDEFRPEPGDLVVYKQRASAFFGTPLVAHLHRLGVDSLIVCGESTSGCVRASVVEAYSYGFHTVVVEECCFDRSLLSHKVSLFDLHHKYADVMHVEDVLRHLTARTQRVV